MHLSDSAAGCVMCDVLLEMRQLHSIQREQPAVFVAARGMHALSLAVMQLQNMCAAASISH